MDSTEALLAVVGTLMDLRASKNVIQAFMDQDVNLQPPTHLRRAPAARINHFGQIPRGVRKRKPAHPQAASWAKCLEVQCQPM
eukprot:1987412-Amphidinium_carterae.1